MATTTESNSTSLSPNPPQPSKQQRVLACILCQQRKIKCDRKYPCAQCVKSKAQCVSASHVARQRRRRFPERELLERLRHYEDLLRKNGVEFEPLHGEVQVGEKEARSGDGVATEESTSNINYGGVAKSIWQSMRDEFRDPDDGSDSSDDNDVPDVIKRAWAQFSDSRDQFLFGSVATTIDVSCLHPEPVQIFRLWQIYLDNVDPLLKVTHAPSLQGRIIAAAANISHIDSNLEALMFSIYCMAISSLSLGECKAMFGLPKEELLKGYQFGCQQALLNCGFLRTSDRDCLTALYLYLVSVRTSTVPQSLSSMLGVAIRIAQRMGIHGELSLSKHDPLEAEMRRRLWWSLILFDTRIGEMCDSKTADLTPSWDCKTPLNVNDSDLRLEMKEPPPVQANSTEALFAVVRSELGDFDRRTLLHSGLTTLASTLVAREIHHGLDANSSKLDALETSLETRYLRFCDEQNPLHFMTLWCTRAYIAKCRLVQHHFKHSSSSPQDGASDTAMRHALRMLESDTALATSPLTKRFTWYLNTYFPFPAYMQLTHHLRRRPLTPLADTAWNTMSANCTARFNLPYHDQQLPHSDKNLFLNLFKRIVTQAWDARREALLHAGLAVAPPEIVLAIHKHTGARDDNVGTAPPLSGLGPFGFMAAQDDSLALDADGFSALDWDMLDTPIASLHPGT